jgi:hypothetical protein
LKSATDTFPYAYYLWNNNLKQTEDGNFITCGTMVDTMEKSFIAKFDTQANLIFFKSYWDTTLNFFYAKDIVELKDKGYLIVFNSNYKGTINNDIVVYRTDTLGNIINKTIQYAGMVEIPWTIRPMLNGNFMIGANSQPNSGYYSKTLMIEIDSMGNNVNQCDTKNLWPYNMQQTADSGWIVVRLHIAYSVGGSQGYNGSMLKLSKGFQKE